MQAIFAKLSENTIFIIITLVYRTQLFFTIKVKHQNNIRRAKELKRFDKTPLYGFRIC